jgi:phosphoglycerol transferase MdoB-like AlkP superfamily enzyme
VAGKSKLPVAGYHIPLIFYAPGLIKPDTFDTRVSQIDLAPTIVELFGKKGDDHFFGRSFFEHGDALKRVFISNYQSLGYWRNDTLTVLLPKGQVESYQVDPKTLATTPAPIDPRLLDETIAYYQSASRAFKAGALVNK